MREEDAIRSTIVIPSSWPPTFSMEAAAGSSMEAAVAACNWSRAQGIDLLGHRLVFNMTLARAESMGAEPSANWSRLGCTGPS